MSTRRIAAVILIFLCPVIVRAADLPAAVKATRPIAYYRLGSLSGHSEVGASQFHAAGAAAVSKQGGQFAGAGNAVTVLDGSSAYVETTQQGGIVGQASIMAWVNLIDLPSAGRHIYYVAGESQNGNDLDLQFETDNQLKFYTDVGGHISYAPPPATLPGRWHMILVTVDGGSGERHIYWDGASVAVDQGAKGMHPKTKAFSIGESPVFTGRHLHGGVDQVALWDRALSAAEVASIYKAADASALPVVLGGVAPGSFAVSAACGAKPAATNPKDMHGVTPPSYLAFLPGVESVGDASYFTWDQAAIPQYGGAGTPDETKSGKHWRFFGRLPDSCNDNTQAWAVLAPGFQKAGWQVVKKYDINPPIVVLHYTQAGTEAWASVSIAQAGGRGVDTHVVEAAPIPIKLTLAKPAAVPETVDPAKGDFPYLTPIPGSHFKGGGHDTRPMYMPQASPQPDELVASGALIKSYDPPDGTSALEFIAVYDQALRAAGWSIVGEKPNELIQAHYGKGGRNLWAYLHINNGGYDINIGDEGSLEAALTQQCHVALTGLLFDFNKATLKPESDGVLQQVLDLMTQHPALKLEIQGHTDNVGDDKYNQTLSEQRAAAVVGWLTQHGVAATRLSSSGYGRTRPVADNKTDEGRAKNRRVEIVNPACKH